VLGPGDLWYKDAIIYALDVATFQDSNGDGVGDFVGLASRIEHIHALGATCVWLAPFYPSPNRDNRYDVADHYGVDPVLGTLGDFVDFLRLARERGLRVLVDLVVNHTSDQHPWFQAARADPGSPYRDYYLWAAQPPPNADTGMVFPGVEKSTWSFDPVAKQYFFHRFYSHQPDLDLGNPAVREEIRKIMGFWLELGVSGFRLDAAPFLIETKGVAHKSVERRRPHTFFRHMRDFLSWRRGDAVLLAEANIAMDEVSDYVGSGDRLQMLLDFHVVQYLFLALATGRASPLAHALRAKPPMPVAGQWANFLRNHDELDLGRLSDAERELVYRAFAPDPAMRLYGRGIRRRLATMLDGDRRRIRLAQSLLLALPGTPVIRYGDEIGMGDDLHLRERDSVRTPMQWSDAHNGGFSSADESGLIRPVIRGERGPSVVNVAAQQRHADSLLSWTQRALGIRRECRELGWGAAEVVDVGEPSVLCIRATHQGSTVVTLHNLSPDERRPSLDLTAPRTTELFSDSDYPKTSEERRLSISGYGFRWFRSGDTRRLGTRGRPATQGHDETTGQQVSR
jgi:maltose alpha-D-glucosyltransferase/alpha-amylase